MVFTRIQRGWLRRAFYFLRWSRVLTYAAISAAGCVALILPPASIDQATGRGLIVQLVWAALMAVSSAFCAWGAATDRWIGEYVGLIPLAAVAAAFAVSALGRGQVGFAAGLFLTGFFWILVSRWQEVALLRVEAERQAEERRHPRPDTDEGGTT